MKIKSPYLNKPESEWLAIAENLIKTHPLKASEIVEAILESWKWILNLKLATFLLKKTFCKV
jgi:hypothetical protein